MKLRSFEEFLSHEGISKVKEVTNTYGHSEVSLADLSLKYEITQYGLKQLIAYAITNCVISYKECMKLKEKAHKGQAKRYSKSNPTTSSDRYYDELFRKRLEYVKNFDDKKVQEIVSAYCQNYHLSTKDIANSFGLSVVEVNALLKKAIIFNIVDDDTVSNLKRIAYSKAIHPKRYERVQAYFSQYEAYRHTYIDKSSQIENLKNQLSTYDDCCTFEHSQTSKAQLESMLKREEQELQKLRNVL